MTTHQCLACGGTYAPVGHDGTPYAHACPPLSDAEVCVKLGVSPDPTTWSAAQRAQIAAASRARPNARNENAPASPVLEALVDAMVVPPGADWAKQASTLRATAMVSAGAGVVTVP